MGLIDTHAHLYDPKIFAVDLKKVITRSLKSGITKIYMPNMNMDTVLPMLKVADTYPNLCKPMIGLHPYYVDSHFKAALEVLAEWLPKRRFTAIGEIGVDLYRSSMYRREQVAALEIQLEWAQKYHLPVVLHCRDSLDLVIDIIKHFKGSSLQGVFHCFSGTLRQAEEIVSMGFYLGIGGIITFKGNSQSSVLTSLGLQHVVLETDSPYLAPTPYRGQRNEPAYMLRTVSTLATIKGVAVAEVAEITTANAESIFSS